ncbi:MAG: hypothetical protein J3R72DRAFT_502094 [Linnemannia gamsii]|nr:MAG: hypothetical protein J3R72DRAFT_502094 [Linnemannia gamsii]
MVTPTSSTRLMATFASIKSPFDFDLPVLRHRPSCFVAGMDAVSCALVCKDWTNDFVSQSVSPSAYGFEQVRVFAHFVSASALMPSSMAITTSATPPRPIWTRLRTLKIEKLCSTHDDLCISATWTFTIPSAMAKDNITQYCPHLAWYLWEDTIGAIVTEFLITITSKNVADICLQYDHPSLEIITVILAHRRSLKSVYGFVKQDFGLMDMNEVEAGKWIYNDLNSILTRIKSVDKKEIILKAAEFGELPIGGVGKWATGTPVTAGDELDATDRSIELTTLHLLKFKNCNGSGSGARHGHHSEMRAERCYQGTSDGDFSLMPTPSTAKRNTFDIPELRHRLSRFVTIKDALSCALVCKAWTDHFISAIWFRIDFKVHPRFADLSLDTVAKNGHLIRIVKNAKKLPQVSVLANAGVNNLRDLHIDPAGSATQYVRAYGIVFRNNMCCKNIRLSATSVPTAKLDSLGHYVPTHALSHSQALTLSRPSILKHVGITYLRSSLQSMFQAVDGGSSLLSYFPRLMAICIYSLDPSFAAPTSQIKENLLRHCSDVAQYTVEDATGAIISEFLLYVGDNITEFTFRYEHTSVEMITCMLVHQLSLTSIVQFRKHDFDLESDTVAQMPEHFRLSGRFLQLIPRCCSQLKTLGLHSHEMDMDVVEMGTWACNDLKTLRIRVKGLDTVDKILRVIALCRTGCWRRWQEKAGKPVRDEVELVETDMSIEARVTRHLLKFDKLWWVWLGYQTWTPI